MFNLSSLKQSISLLWQKYFGPKYIRAGHCKQCGICCRTITLKHEEIFITEEKQFEALKNWQKRYKNFFISGKDENGILLFTCKWLTDDNKCKHHMLRSMFCRAYPFIKTDFIAAGGQTLEGCGYYYSVSESFEDIIKKLK